MTKTTDYYVEIYDEILFAWVNFCGPLPLPLIENVISSAKKHYTKSLFRTVEIITQKRVL